MRGIATLADGSSIMFQVMTEGIYWRENIILDTHLCGISDIWVIFLIRLQFGRSEPIESGSALVAHPKQVRAERFGSTSFT